MKPDDCEDWAMFIRMLFTCFKHNTFQPTEFAGYTTGLQKITEEDWNGLLTMSQVYHNWAQNGMLTVDMVCGSAGAPSMTNEKFYGPPSGHEFCILHANIQNILYANVLEGTNWTCNTMLPEQDCKQLIKTFIDHIKDTKGISEPRVCFLQNMGINPENPCATFYRCVYSLADKILIGVSKNKEGDGIPTRWGVTVPVLLQNLRGENDSVSMRKITAIYLRESKPSDGDPNTNTIVDDHPTETQHSLVDTHIQWLKNAFDELQLPQMKENQFIDEYMSKWAQLPPWNEVPDVMKTHTKKQIIWSCSKEITNSDSVDFMGVRLHVTRLPFTPA
eukprot:2294720-Rhodomonas_salina.1